MKSLTPGQLEFMDTTEERQGFHHWCSDYRDMTRQERKPGVFHFLWYQSGHLHLARVWASGKVVKHINIRSKRSNHQERK